MNVGTTVLTQYCNIYGGENDGGAKRVLGGLGPQTPSKQWYCATPAIGRFIMSCEHGHTGMPMHLCEPHLRQYKDAVSFCPRCNQEPGLGHKCRLKIVGK